MERRLIVITVEVPASVANLGSGYDCLALAIELQNSFRLYCDIRAIGPDDHEYEFHLRGRYGDSDTRMLKPDGNLFVQAFRDVRQYLCVLAGYPVPRCPILVCQEVTIPPMRGLGSSSSASVAGALAGIKFIEAVYPNLRPNELLAAHPDFKGSNLNDIIASLAMAVDSCPDNICASLSGGLTYSFCESDRGVLWGRSPLLHYFQQSVEDPDLRCIALIPSVTLETPEARKVLESCAYKVSDVAFNISRSTCLPAAIRDKRYSLLRAITQDRIHQTQRIKALFTNDRGNHLNLESVFEAVLDAGAYAAFIGGAGSALIALADALNAEVVASRFRQSFEAVAMGKWSVEDLLTLRITNQGAVAVLRESLLPNEELARVWFDKVGEGWLPLELREPEKASIGDASPSKEQLVLQALLPMHRISLRECTVLGDYRRYDQRVRNSLRDWRKRIERRLVSTPYSRANFLIWAAPGSGKTSFVENVAKANASRVRYISLNLADLDKDALSHRLAEVRGWTEPTLCLLDEVDKRKEYDECISTLDLSGNYGRAVVFVLVGSGFSGMQGMLDAIAGRSSGKDLIDRLPKLDRFEIPRLSIEDRVTVIISKAADLAGEQGRKIREVERFALYYMLTNQDLSSPRQLRDLVKDSIERVDESDDRLQFCDLFMKGDRRADLFYAANREADDALSGTFVLIDE